MVDIHAHILPRLDDGSESIADTIELMRLAASTNIDTIVATPHCNQSGRFKNYWSQEFSKYFEMVRNEICRQKIPITILPGMEIFASNDICRRIENGQLIGINKTDYYLIEFRFDETPENITYYLRDILSIGKIPIIAHPERYICIQEYPYLVFKYIQMGCLTQINKGSILGKFGRYAKKTADILLKERLVTCIASDAHNPYIRTTSMKEICEYLLYYFGEFTMYELMEKNPRSIICGNPINMNRI